MEEDEPDIICWGYHTVNEHDVTVVDYFKKYESKPLQINGIEALNKIILQNSMWIWTGSAAYKRDFLLRNRLSYTNECVSGEDQEFTFKALIHAETVSFIPRILSYYLIRKGSLSNSYNIRVFDSMLALQRVYDHIIDSSIEALTETAVKIKKEYYIANYLYDFDLCLKSLIDKNIPQKQAVRKVNADIENNYPQLSIDIKTWMKQYKGGSRKLLLRIKTFQISPLLHLKLVSHFARG